MQTALEASAEIKKLAELIDDARIATLTTQGLDGSLHSRPLTTLRPKDFDGTLWFIVAADAEKIKELEQCPHVNLGYSHPEKGTYVSISGIAEVVYDEDKARELWTPMAKIWFPQGLDDPNLAVLKVEVYYAEYWIAPSSKVERLWGLSKTRLHADKRPRGEHLAVYVGAQSH